MITRSADAVVIGAGVIGSSVALELARSGRDVVVVDRGPAAGAGSTSASAAIIRFSYSTPDAILAAWEAATMWRHWADHLGGTDPDGMATFVECPNLTFRTTGYDPDEMLARWREYGIDQFVGPRTGRAIDLGAFSRQRARAATTNSVLG